MRKNQGHNYGQSIGKEKALKMEENQEIKNIFVEDATGKRIGGYKTIEEAEQAADIVYLSLKRGKVYRVKKVG